MHFLGLNWDNYRLAVPFADLEGSIQIGRKVYLLPGTLNQSQLLYGIEESNCGAVVESCGRLFRSVLKVYFDAVTLGSSDSRAIVRELKSLLVILSHDCIKFFAGDSVSAGSTSPEQIIYTAPTGIIES